jgi:hypothetical protein
LEERRLQGVVLGVGIEDNIYICARIDLQLIDNNAANNVPIRSEIKGLLKCVWIAVCPTVA